MLQGREKVYTVTAITRLIKYTLEESWRSIWVEGEISNYLHHRSGHRYLSLKDENATLKLTIWRSVGQNLKFEPEDGMKVRAWGDISVYEKGGIYQLNVRKLEPVGIGELEIAFRQLYEKLASEGLFDDSLKNPIPKFARKIGIVTSPTGAAIRDIIQIAERRNDSVELVIFPAQVQGDGAAESIVSGIEYFNGRDDIDLIIIGRGGGSLEDLWAFNEEILVRAVALSEKPVVSAVGHEIDTTLSDLVADLRAPTPSAAAELTVWDKNEFLNLLSSRISEMEYNLDSIFENSKYRLFNLARRPVYARPESMIYERQQRFDNLFRLFENSGKNVLEKLKNSLSFSLSRLESMSPLAILNRGYAVLKDIATGKTVRTVAELRRNDSLEAILKDGSAFVKVENVKKSDLV